MNKPKTAAQRKRDERERNRAAGFQLAQVWIHPDDYAALRRYVDIKNRRREGVAR